MSTIIDVDIVLDRYYAEYKKQDICDGSQDRDWLMRCLEEAPVVEYAPIVRCGNCMHFVPAENVEDDDWEGECMYNDCTYVDTSDFCSRGEARRDTEVKKD